MSEEHLYDLSEIAKATNISIQSITNRANKGRKGNKNHPAETPWIVHSIVKKNGQKTRLFGLNTLPKDIQKALRKAMIQASADAAQAKHEIEMAKAGISLAEKHQKTDEKKQKDKLDRMIEGRKKFNALEKNDSNRLRARGREWIVLGVNELARTGMTKEKARERLTNEINHEDIVVPTFVWNIVPTTYGRRNLSCATVRGWQSDYKHGGIGALIPNWGTRKGCTKIAQNPALYRFVLGALIKWPQITSKTIKQALEADHPELNIVSARRIGDFLKVWKIENAHLWTFITNPDRWKNIYMAGVGSVFENITAPNQLWELDSTPGDWLLTDGRHSVVGCIEMYSRRVKLFVSKSSTAAAVKQVLRRSLLDWGVPCAIRTDNGKDYVSDELSCLLRDLDIVQEVCIPFASEEKGTIERFFRTMSHGMLNLLDGFIGHNVADRKAIESRKSFASRIMKKDEVVEVAMSSEELQVKLDEWVEHYYENSEHGGLKGKTPLQMWREWKEPHLTFDDHRGLDELLNKIKGTRVIGKKGIQYNNRFYFDPAGVMFEHVGKSVTLGQDEQDIGRLTIYMDGQFLCWAEDPDMTGISRRELGKAIKHGQKKLMTAQAAVLKEFTKDIKRNPVEAIIEHKKSEAENIVDLPRKGMKYSTPALEQALIAADEKDGKPTEPSPLNKEELKHQAQLEKELSQPAPVIELHTESDRYERAYKLERKEHLNAEEEKWLSIYQKSSEYRVQKEIYEDFGIAIELDEAK